MQTDNHQASVVAKSHDVEQQAEEVVEQPKTTHTNQLPNRSTAHREEDETEQYYYYSENHEDEEENDEDDNNNKNNNNEEMDTEEGDAESKTAISAMALQHQMVKGTLAQNLMEKIVRNKIIGSTYYKTNCFGLTAETLLDKAMDLEFIGGTYGGTRRPSAFLCLLFKLLQIQPEREIVLAYITNKNHKYVTVLGALYLRLTGKPVDVYTYLELLYSDYRKIIKQNVNGKYEVTHIDEIADELLTSNYAYDINLPYLPKRRILEESGLLDARITVLENWQQLVVNRDDKHKHRDDRERHGDEQRYSERYYERVHRSTDDDRYRSDSHRRDRRELDSTTGNSKDDHRRSHHTRNMDDRERNSRYREDRNYDDDRTSRYDRDSRDRRREDDNHQHHGDRRKDRYSYDDRSRYPRDEQDRRSDDYRSSSGKKYKSSSGYEIALSVEDTNRIRARLGMRPLRL